MASRPIIFCFDEYVNTLKYRQATCQRPLRPRREYYMAYPRLVLKHIKTLKPWVTGLSATALADHRRREGVSDVYFAPVEVCPAVVIRLEQGAEGTNNACRNPINSSSLQRPAYSLVSAFSLERLVRRKRERRSRTYQRSY